MPWASLDLGLEPDVAHLLGDASGDDATFARSTAWLGATLTLLRGRLVLHAEAGPSLNDVALDPLTARAAAAVRF